MAQTRVYHRSFGGGEVSPEMYGRIDDVRFQTGAATMRNFIALPQGPAENRPGFAFVREVKDSTKRTRLLPFTFSTTQTLVLELGAGYFRFHTQGATLGPGTPAAYNGATAYAVGALVSSGGVNYYCIAATTGNAPPNATYWYALPAGIYEIPNPYAEADLFDIHYVQSADVLTLVHPNYAPRELRRLGATTWTLTTISFVPEVTTPTGVSVTANRGQSLNITAITQASPGVITTIGNHGLAVDDPVYVDGGTMTQLRGYFSVNATPGLTTLSLKAYDSGVPVNTTSYTAWSGGGFVQFGDRVLDFDSYYVVTAVDSNGIDESAPSVAVSVTNNLNAPGSSNTISWTASPGAVLYNVYKRQSGLYGYIGQTQATSFTDNNIAPNLGLTPPIADTTFVPGSILSVPITNGGSGYGSTVTSGGVIQSVAVIAGGTNYDTNESLTAADSTGSGATFTVTESAGVITAIAVTNGGSNYTNPTFTAGGANTSGFPGPIFVGSGARLLPTITPLVYGTVTIGVTDATGTGAVLEPVISGGVITQIRVVNGGRNYTNPTITVTSAAGGSSAAFGPAVLSQVQYPGAVSYFEQRRVFAGTTLQPQTLWMTRTGTESDMSFHIPLQDSDRISFTVAAREANTIRHLVPLTQLLALTSAAEWRISPVNSDTITPTTISVRPQSYVGANNVQPSIVNNTVVYCSARDGHVRELGYSWQASGFVTGDLSLRATHLFDNFDISDMCYSKAPQPLLWFISSTGRLLGLTYIPEQQIGAWHRHDTDGSFESCTAVAEGVEDRLYVIVKRTIGGVTKRYVERMASRQITTLDACFFVDSGLSYDGRNTTSTTVTVTGGTNWTPAEVLTITSSTPIFQFPATTDVGDAIVITAPDGTQYRLAILGTSSTTVATAKVDKTLGVAFRGVATTSWSFARDTISGLGHLEGKTVSILGDGAVMPQKVVTGGTVPLQRASSIVHVGLPYESDLQTLPMTLQIEGFGQGRAKNINEAFLRVVSSSGIFIGPTASSLVEAKQRTTEPYGSPPSLKTDEIGVKLTPSWQQSGQIFVRQSDPLPLTIVGLTLEVSIGG
jgi:hypothetical protein